MVIWLWLVYTNGSLACTSKWRKLQSRNKGALELSFIGLLRSGLGSQTRLRSSFTIRWILLVKVSMVPEVPEYQW
ncbi:hypothetical protein EV426DRAFT_606210 [Tirmania nivea]|nr:hypothetical protein EV426DRAFT_606210 [Tirmania nivea]